MSKIASQVCHWVEQGHITAEQANTLYGQLASRPNVSSWRGLIAHLLLWFGALSVACGLIFFFAYNWQSLGRFAKFGLIEVTILLTIAVFAWLYYRAAHQFSSVHQAQTEANTGNQANTQPTEFGATTANAVLLAASVLVGGLLALVGQTYQTGADPWQLFALWALLILPFAWVAGFDALWLLVVALFNLSLGLLFDTFAHFWGDFWDEQRLLLIFICLNLAIYYAFVFLDRKVAGRWHAPLVEYASSMFAMGCFTLLICWLIFDDALNRGEFNSWIFCGYIAHLGIGFLLFRYVLPRIYPLALGGFSFIVVGAALLINVMFENNDPIGGFLFIGLYIILASSGLSMGLRKLSRLFKLSPAILSTKKGTVGELHGRK